MKRILPMTVLPLAVSAALIAPMAQARGVSEADEIRALQEATMSLSEAVTRVNEQHPGTPVNAEWDYDKATDAWGYEVEVADTSGTSLETFFINASSGDMVKVDHDRVKRYDD